MFNIIFSPYFLSLHHLETALRRLTIFRVNVRSWALCYLEGDGEISYFVFFFMIAYQVSCNYDSVKQYKMVRIREIKARFSHLKNCPAPLDFTLKIVTRLGSVVY